MHGVCMASICINVSTEAHARLKKLKGPGDSFSDVILRELPNPCDTAGELLDRLEGLQLPKGGFATPSGCPGRARAEVQTMILDTSFVSDLMHERDLRQRGRAGEFLAGHRTERLMITVITVGEIAAMYTDTQDARQVLSNYRQLRLTPEIAFAAAIVDREPVVPAINTVKLGLKG